MKTLSESTINEIKQIIQLSRDLSLKGYHGYTPDESKGCRDVGPFLEDLLNQVGYELELHQLGIDGTLVVARPLSPG